MFRFVGKGALTFEDRGDTGRQRADYVPRQPHIDRPPNLFLPIIERDSRTVLLLLIEFVTATATARATATLKIVEDILIL